MKKDIDTPDPSLELPDIQHWARTLIYDGLAQTDIDMAHHKLVNLDTSNLIGLGSPPTIHPAPSVWLHDWDNTTGQWTTRQPHFADLLDNLTAGPLGQQRAITELGIIHVGFWRASVIEGLYVAPLNLLQAPIGDVSMANHKLTNLSDPTNPQDAVNKRFMDFLLQGINPKAAVRLASTTEHPLAGLLGVDGKPLVNGDRVLLKNQVTRPYENGIWIASTGPWSRPVDADTGEELTRAYCFVMDGTQNINTAWVQVATLANGPITSGETPTFVLFSVAIGGSGPPGPPGPGVPVGGHAGDILSKIDDIDFNSQWIPVPGVTPALAYNHLQTVALINPAGTTSQVFVMMGIGRDNAVKLAPTASGKFVVAVSGSVLNDNAAGGAVLQLWFGFSTLVSPPRNGDLPPTIPGSSIAFCKPQRGFLTTHSAPVPFSMTGMLTGIALGGEMWVDVALAATGTLGSRASIIDCAVTIYEIP